MTSTVHPFPSGYIVRWQSAQFSLVVYIFYHTNLLVAYLNNVLFVRINVLNSIVMLYKIRFPNEQRKRSGDEFSESHETNEEQLE